jgi:hypothetical protein
MGPIPDLAKSHFEVCVSSLVSIDGRPKVMKKEESVSTRHGGIGCRSSMCSYIEIALYWTNSLIALTLVK